MKAQGVCCRDSCNGVEKGILVQMNKCKYIHALLNKGTAYIHICIYIYIDIHTLILVYIYMSSFYWYALTLESRVHRVVLSVFDDEAPTNERVLSWAPCHFGA